MATMFAPRRTASAVSRHFAQRAAWSIPMRSSRLFATAASETTTTPEESPAPTSTAKTTATKPASSTSSSSTATSRAAKAKPTTATTTAAAKASSTIDQKYSALSHSDVVYQLKPIVWDAAKATAPVDNTSVDWAHNFHSISSKPVTEAQYKELMAPLEIKDIEVKPDGIIYLPEIKYRRKLNEVFGPMGWGLIPKGQTVVGENIVTREYALIADGRFVSQAQGENNYFSADQLPSAVEGCKSNALMRCCKDLGIASELWDPHFIRWFKKSHMEEVWVEHLVTKKKKVLWYKKGEVDVQYPFKATK